MIRTFLLGTACAAFLAAGTASALDLSNMSAAERQAFGEVVRQYLLENPEVLMEAMAILEEREAEAQAQAERGMVAANATALFDDGHSYVGGNPDGDVTVVEFLDYKCGFCRRAHPEVAQLVGTDGNIRVIVKEFPILGEESMLASRFAIAVLQIAGPEAYKAASDAIMEMRGAVNRESLAAIATRIDVNAEEILNAMSSEAVSDVIRENRALAQELAINGTPTFVFGDRMIRGYLPLDGMREVVSDLRADG